MAENVVMTQEEFASLTPGEVQIIDIRDASSTAYGIIPGAKNIPSAELMDRAGELDAAKPAILYCARGIFSVEAAENLRGRGINAFSLDEGYAGWVMAQMQRDEDEAERRYKIEESIRKTYHRRLFSQFARAIRTYDLLQPGDRVAVCISGGKDSMLMAKLFQELQRHHKFEFDLKFLVMDPGYNAANRSVIEHNAKLLGIPITIFETDIFDIVYGEEKNPCYLCARMRRGHLYSKARELGCNKIALGHHYDDVIENNLNGNALRRAGTDDDAQTTQHQLPGHGTDPSALLHPRKRHKGVARLQRSPLHPMRLPLHGHLHHLRPGRPHRLQTHGNQKPDRRNEKGKSRRKKPTSSAAWKT